MEQLTFIPQRVSQVWMSLILKLIHSMEPSIAGVVGSTNIQGLGYAAKFSVQPGHQDIIEELELLSGVSLFEFHFPSLKNMSKLKGLIWVSAD